MNSLIPDAGKFRNENVGVFSEKEVAHVTARYTFVPQLMEELVTYVKKETTIHPLILSSVFHYELEFIHPFMDGNGRLNS